MCSSDLAAVFIDRTGYQDTENAVEPTSTIYEQLMNYFNTARQDVVESMRRAERAAETVEHIDGGSFEDWDGEGNS